jgi:FixJ family two-component response regulator
MKTIMIVDDEVAIHEKVKTYLENNEVDVLTFSCIATSSSTIIIVFILY